MITIFDFNPTKAELIHFLSIDKEDEEDLKWLTKEGYLAEYTHHKHNHPEQNLGHLYGFLLKRGKPDKAFHYLNQIQDEEYREDVYFTFTPLHRG
ncbi:MAG TPA: hypothetical protein DCS93_05680 [Microscillaceae bacterium]|nr:hypothetical protein [Microscillaceae bacterium]